MLGCSRIPGLPFSLGWLTIVGLAVGWVVGDVTGAGAGGDTTGGDTTAGVAGVAAAGGAVWREAEARARGSPSAGVAVDDRLLPPLNALLARLMNLDRLAFSGGGPEPPGADELILGVEAVNTQFLRDED